MKKLKRKLTNRLLSIAIVSVLVTAVSISVACWLSFSSQSDKDLAEYGNILVESYNNDPSVELLEKYDPGDFRITLIDSSGTVLFESDSSVNADEMSNHLSRPEVKEALASGSGTDSRTSDTLGEITYYYAVKADNGNVLRVAREINSVISLFLGLIPIVLVIIAYVLVISIVMASESTKKIIEPIEEMTDDISNVAYEELVPFATTIENQQKQIKKQMNRLQLEKDKINALIANMNEGFLLIDMDKNILAENDSAEVLLGASGRNHIGRNIIEVSRNEDFLNIVNEAIDGRDVTSKYDYKEKTVQILCSPVVSGAKQSGVICLIMDITEREKSEKLRREFTANVSHELKTPLTSISGYAEMIENGMAKEEDIQRFAGKIRKESARLITLIGDIIELSNLEDNENDFELEDVRVKEIAQECVEALSQSALKNNVTINLSGDDAVIKSNSSMLYELIFNLCDNAVRYNKANGKVDIEIDDMPAAVEITVTDTGIGIPQKHQARIFERFYRVDKSHSKSTGGTGLGLAIVKHIVDRLSGTIHLESIVDAGTEIIVTIPKKK